MPKLIIRPFINSFQPIDHLPEYCLDSASYLPSSRTLNMGYWFTQFPICRFHDIFSTKNNCFKYWVGRASLCPPRLDTDPPGLGMPGYLLFILIVVRVGSTAAYLSSGVPYRPARLAAEPPGIRLAGLLEFSGAFLLCKWRF